MNYEYCSLHIDKSQIHSIFELGARDCEDSLWLASQFQCPVVAFECNPEAIQRCRTTLRTAEPHPFPVTLVEQAVQSYNGETTFYSVSSEDYINIGMSSLFKHVDSSLTDSKMKAIQTPCTRLDTFLEIRGLRAPDLICMDLQGAELVALQSLGERLRDVKYIATELCFEPSYEGATTFQEIYPFLLDKGFDIEYIPFHMKYIHEILKGEYTIAGEFDMIFSRSD